MLYPECGIFSKTDLGEGRTRAITQHQYRYSVTHTRCHRFQKAISLRNDLLNASVIRVSTQTDKNPLYDAVLRARRSAMRIFNYPAIFKICQTRLQPM